MLQPYQTTDHTTARLVAAILYRFGETSVTISTDDLLSLPPGQIESEENPHAQSVTYRFRQHPAEGQADLPLELAHTLPSEVSPHDFPGDLLARLAQIAPPAPMAVLTDAELILSYEEVCNEWDSMNQEDMARGGSPLEGLSEKINEIETEAKRRGLALT